ncbi:MAG TPA: translocation protein TolB [Pseudobdellovibrionaceae bacterium]|nr:translocation protein TolB [Pseudobdellovibrionaceae bacterium]
MKYIINLIIISVLLTLSFAKAEEADIKIRLGEAQIKKSLIAFPKPLYLGSPTQVSKQTLLGAEFFETVVNDLSVSSYFQFISASAFLEDANKIGLKPKPGDPNGFKFDAWSAIGAEFLLRVGYSVTNKDLEIETYFYHIPTAKLTMGKKYKSTTDNVRRVAHTFSNDIIKALTGKPGMFLSKIVVATDRDVAPQKEIYVMDWDGQNAFKISNHRSITLSPAWSYDNKKIAYTAYVKKKGFGGRNADLFIYDLASGFRTLLSYKKGVNSGVAFYGKENSVFMTHSHGSDSNIYKISLAGKVVGQITKGPLGALNVEPAYCEKNDLLAFSSDRSGRPMIYTSDSDGSSVKRITMRGVFNSSPSWSPDCSKIAFSGQDNNNFDIFIMDPDGKNINRITKALKSNGRLANNEDPTFSPNGQYIMYTSNRTGNSQIYISTIDGREERRITNDNHNYYKPKWSNNFE